MQVRPGKGLPHAEAVADVLCQAGYDDGVQTLALLHDAVEDTARTVDDVRDAFGEPMAAMVGALTEDPSIRHYAQRKRDLRARTLAAGSPAVDVASGRQDRLAAGRAAHRHAAVWDRKLRHYTVMLQLSAHRRPGHRALRAARSS